MSYGARRPLPRVRLQNTAAAGPHYCVHTLYTHGFRLRTNTLPYRSCAAKYYVYTFITKSRCRRYLVARAAPSATRRPATLAENRKRIYFTRSIRAYPNCVSLVYNIRVYHYIIINIMRTTSSGRNRLQKRRPRHYDNI